MPSNGLPNTRDLLERAGRSAGEPAYDLGDLAGRRDRRRRRRQAGAAVVALGLSAAVAVLAFGFVGLGGRTTFGSTGSTRPSGDGPATSLPAAMSAPLQAAPGEYYYARTWRRGVDSCTATQDGGTSCSSSVVRAETWWAPDESGRIATTTGDDVFAAGGFPHDTITTGLPTDPEALRTAMFERSGANGASPEPQTTVSPGQDGGDASVEQSIVNLLSMPNTTPALRAALLEVLAGLPDVRVELDATDPVGRPAYRLTVTTFGGPLVHELYVDPATHELLAHVQRSQDGAAWDEVVLIDAGVAASTEDRPATSVVPGPVVSPSPMAGPVDGPSAVPSRG
jgi:hypothetical protein